MAKPICTSHSWCTVTLGQACKRQPKTRLHQNAWHEPVEEEETSICELCLHLTRCLNCPGDALGFFKPLLVCVASLL